MRRRQEQLRARLEERQRAVKNAIEQRKKEQILKKYVLNLTSSSHFFLKCA